MDHEIYIFNKGFVFTEEVKEKIWKLTSINRE